MAQPSIQLLSRSCTVTVGTVQVSNVGQKIGIDVWFSVRRSLKPGEPNTADLKLYNLSDATRKQIDAAAQPIPGATTTPGSQPKAVPVKIVAGYEGGTSTLFLGEMRSAQHVQDGPDTVTELQTGDGDEAMLLSRSTSHIPGGTTAYAVAQTLCKDMGVGTGNISAVAPVLQAATLYKRGVTLKGSSWDHLLDLARGCGLEVTIQGGVTQWTSLGQPLAGEAYVLQSQPTNTGLVGSPSVDTKGVLSAECLMLPGMRPGAPVSLRAKFVQGLFRITSIETTGDTRGEAWGHSLECKRIGNAP